MEKNISFYACAPYTKAQTWVYVWLLFCMGCLSAITQSASLSFSHFYECVWVGAGEPVLPPVFACVRECVCALDLLDYLQANYITPIPFTPTLPLFLHISFNVPPQSPSPSTHTHTHTKSIDSIYRGTSCYCRVVHEDWDHVHCVPVRVVAVMLRLGNGSCCLLLRLRSPACFFVVFFVMYCFVLLKTKLWLHYLVCWFDVCPIQTPVGCRLT